MRYKIIVKDAIIIFGTILNPVETLSLQQTPGKPPITIKDIAGTVILKYHTAV